MAAPDHRASGGGSNYQCLPSDAEYDKYAPTAPLHSVLRRVWYEIQMTPNVFPKPLHQHLVPCAVCEANQRITKLMMPAAVRCPTSDWTLEFKGYLMTIADTYNDKVTIIANNYYKTTYECVDQESESLTSAPNTEWTGSPIYLSRAQCSGDGALGSCPPYQTDKALSCVVCTK